MDAGPVEDPADAVPRQLADLPSWRLTRAAQRSHRLLTEAVTATGHRGYDVRVLLALDVAGPAHQAALGRRTGLDRSDVVDTVRRLEEGGEVSRLPDPADGRRKVVTLTAAGGRALALLQPVLDDVQERLLAPLTTGERAELVRLLTRLDV